jgi:hypothetical protein
MRLLTEAPEPHVMISLSSRRGGITVRAVSSDGTEQDLLTVVAVGQPTAGDPLAQRDQRIRVETHQLNPNFPAIMDDEGHIEIVQA